MLSSVAIRLGHESEAVQTVFSLINWVNQDQKGSHSFNGKSPKQEKPQTKDNPSKNRVHGSSTLLVAAISPSRQARVYREEGSRGVSPSRTKFFAASGYPWLQKQ